MKSFVSRWAGIVSNHSVIISLLIRRSDRGLMTPQKLLTVTLHHLQIDLSSFF